MDSRSRKRSLSSDKEVETPPKRQKKDAGVFDLYIAWAKNHYHSANITCWPYSFSGGSGKGGFQTIEREAWEVKSARIANILGLRPLLVQ